MRNLDLFPNKEADVKANPAVYGIVSIILVYIGRIQELFPFLDNLHIGKFVVILGLLLLASVPKVSRNGISVFPPLVKILLLLIFFMIASIPFGVHPTYSFDSFLDFSKTLVLLYILLKAVNTVKELALVFWGVALTLFVLGFKTVMLERVGRLAVSSTYDPNDLAFVMVSLLPIVYFLAKEEKTMAKRLFLYATLALSVMTVILTVSRGGFIGFLVISVAILKKESVSIKKSIVPLAIIAGMFIWFAPQEYWDRMYTTFDNSDYNYSNQTGGGRMEVWKRGLTIMKENPVLGVGFNCFAVAEGLSHGGLGKWSTAHNSFVQVGAELGVIGLFLFSKLIFESVRSIRVLREEVKNKNIISGCLPDSYMSAIEISFYGYLAAGFFLSQGYSTILYILVSLTAICQKIGKYNTAGKPI